MGRGADFPGPLMGPRNSDGSSSIIPLTGSWYDTATASSDDATPAYTAGSAGTSSGPSGPGLSDLGTDADTGHTSSLFANRVTRMGGGELNGVSNTRAPDCPNLSDTASSVNFSDSKSAGMPSGGERKKSRLGGALL